MDKATSYITQELKKRLLVIGYPAHVMDDILKDQVFKFFRYHDLHHKVEKIYTGGLFYGEGGVGYRYSIDLGMDWRSYEGADAGAYCVKSDEIFTSHEEAECACINRLLKIYETRSTL